jgi:hypothetical protein
MKELKKLIKKEFLPLLSPYGFILYRSNLIVEPINDLLKGFCFDRSHNHLYVHLFIQPLYVPATFQDLSYGWRLKGQHALGDMFLLDDEHIEFTKSELNKLILKEKGWLQETKTAFDFYTKFLISDLKLTGYKTKINLRYQETLTYTEAYIYPGRACNLVEEFLKKWEKDDRKDIEWMQEIKNNMLRLKQGCDSKEKIQELFNEWKKYTSSNLKLENI